MSMLFSPITIRGVELKNRIMMSPMGTVAADEEGKLTEWQYVHYGARALGQVGLVMLEVTAVEERGGDPGSLGLWNDNQVPNLRRLAGTIQRLGAKAGIQLGHAGRKKRVGNRLILVGIALPGTADRSAYHRTNAGRHPVVQGCSLAGRASGI